MLVDRPRAQRPRASSAMAGTCGADTRERILISRSKNVHPGFVAMGGGMLLARQICFLPSTLYQALLQQRDRRLGGRPPLSCCVLLLIQNALQLCLLKVQNRGNRCPPYPKPFCPAQSNAHSCFQSAFGALRILLVEVVVLGSLTDSFSTSGTIEETRIFSTCVPHASRI